MPSFASADAGAIVVHDTAAVNDYVRKTLRFGGEDEYVFWAPDIYNQ